MLFEKVIKLRMVFGIPVHEISPAFTNKLDFFPNTFKPEEDKNGNGVLDPGEDFYGISPDGKIDYSKEMVS